MSADQLTILAVDDEPTQLADLARLLRASPAVGDVECALDGHDALLKASSQDYDAIFLDVRMPQLDGLELGRVLRRFAVAPQLVFVSAYDNAAADAFELHALDYLRKPVARGRVEEAVERVSAAVEAGPARPARPARPGAPAGGGGVHVETAIEDSEMIAVANLHGGSTRLLARGTICYIQAYGDFVRIVTADGRYLLRCTLAEIEHRWAPHGFFRVHRQYVVNLRQAVELRPQRGGTAVLAFAGGQAIPVARRHSAELARHLGV
jgi:DNA-binding LytR/AlgR family response regulator